LGRFLLFAASASSSQQRFSLERNGIMNGVGKTRLGAVIVASGISAALGISLADHGVLEMDVIFFVAIISSIIVAAFLGKYKATTIPGALLAAFAGAVGGGALAFVSSIALTMLGVGVVIALKEQGAWLGPWLYPISAAFGAIEAMATTLYVSSLFPVKRKS
jgi:hypothetical protein